MRRAQQRCLDKANDSRRLHRRRMAVERLESRAMLDASAFDFGHHSWVGEANQSPAHLFVVQPYSLPTNAFAEESLRNPSREFGDNRSRNQMDQSVNIAAHEFLFSNDIFSSPQVVYHVVAIPPTTRMFVTFIRPVTLPLPQSTSSLSPSARTLNSPQTNDISRLSDDSITHAVSMASGSIREISDSEAREAKSSVANADQMRAFVSAPKDALNEVRASETQQATQRVATQASSESSPLGLQGMLPLGLLESKGDAANRDASGHNPLGLELEFQLGLSDDIVVDGNKNATWQVQAHTARLVAADRSLANEPWIEPGREQRCPGHDLSPCPEGMLALEIMPSIPMTLAPMNASIDPLALIQLFVGSHDGSEPMEEPLPGVGTSDAFETRPSLLQEILLDPRAATLSSIALGMIAIATARHRNRSSSRADLAPSTISKPS